MSRTIVGLLAVLVVAAPVALVVQGASGGEDVAVEIQSDPPDEPATERAVFVGNNWEGTADVHQFDPGQGEFSHVATLNIIPDIDERRTEMATDPERLGYYLGIRMLVGEGNDQYVDDMYSTPDGETLVVSRPSLADVIGLDIDTGEIEWRFEVDGQRSDHMALSPDGQRVAVSASTGNVVHILDVHTGKELWTFESGDSPHENIYSADGSTIYHASIGLVYTPADRPPLQDATKGEQYFQIVDAQTHEVVKRLDMGEELEEAGYEDMSSAVRPMTFSPNERFVYFQVSFFHGFIKYDLENFEVVDVVELPNHIPNQPRETYLLDSAHHGIEMNEAGTDLCVAGTMSDYAAIVPVDDYDDYTLVDKGDDAKPYWATVSDDGEHCFVSWSGHDSVSAISYATGEETDEIDVGEHPQRVRTGNVQSDWVQAQTS